MNIYKALPLNNLELNIKTIYFTDAYLKNDVINPVTQTAEVEVNKLSKKGVNSPLLDDIGRLNIIAPNKITIEKPKAKIWTALNFIFFVSLMYIIKPPT